MLFSNDETAAAIDQVVDIPVQSFSSVVCGCLFRDKKDDLSLLLKDIMSLATRVYERESREIKSSGSRYRYS